MSLTGLRLFLLPQLCPEQMGIILLTGRRIIPCPELSESDESCLDDLGSERGNDSLFFDRFWRLDLVEFLALLSAGYWSGRVTAGTNLEGAIGLTLGGAYNGTTSGRTAAWGTARGA
jgi:hypothetical protein